MACDICAHSSECCSESKMPIATQAELQSITASAEIGQTASAEIGQTASAETGQTASAETGHMASASTAGPSAKEIVEKKEKKEKGKEKKDKTKEKKQGEEGESWWQRGEALRPKARAKSINSCC